MWTHSRTAPIHLRPSPAPPHLDFLLGAAEGAALQLLAAEALVMQESRTVTPVQLNPTVLLDQDSRAPGGPQLASESIDHRSFQKQLHEHPTLSISQGGWPAGGDPNVHRLFPTALRGIAPTHYRARSCAENTAGLIERENLIQQSKCLTAACFDQLSRTRRSRHRVASAWGLRPLFPYLRDGQYWVDTAFRDRTCDSELAYMEGATSAAVIWRPGVQPLPLERYGGRERRPLMPRRTASHQPVNVNDLAVGLPRSAFRAISWRDRSNAPLSDRISAQRVQHGGRKSGRAQLRPGAWLLIESPMGGQHQLTHSLSPIAEDAPRNDLMSNAHIRRCTESDHQKLKKESGLDHYKGDGWRDLHQHATLSIAPYGIPVGEQIVTGEFCRIIEPPCSAKFPPIPRVESGEVSARAPSHIAGSLATLRHQLRLNLLARLTNHPFCATPAARPRLWRGTLRRHIQVSTMRTPRPFSPVRSGPSERMKILPYDFV